MAAVGQFRPDDDQPEKDPSSSCCSSSNSVIQTVTGSHLYNVKGYSLAKGMGLGKYMASDIFSVGGYDWQIQFYPDGKKPEDPFNFKFPSPSAYIVLASDDRRDLRALFELKLQDQSGNEQHHGDSLFNRGRFVRPTPTFKTKGFEWVVVFTQRVLESPDFLKNDGLVIKATVGVFTTRHEKKAVEAAVTVPRSNLGQGFKELLESEVGWDVEFRVGDDGTFRAHKSILAARSPFFRAKFFGPAGDPNLNEVTPDDIHPSIFKVMLRFIYTDELPDVHDIMGSSPSMSGATNIMQHLLVAADLYNLDRLKLFCESKLCEEVNAVSVATTLALAEQHQCAQLKAVCLKFAANPTNLGVVMQSEGFKHLEQSCPSMLRELLEALASANGDDEDIAECSNQNTRRVKARH